MTLLLLAGTREAIDIAERLAAEGRDAVARLAGHRRSLRPLALATEVGGFGGAEGFARYLHEAGITAVLDATHPFAARISLRTAQVCADQKVPYAQVLRPQWRPQAGDRWTCVDAEEAAAEHIPKGSTVFLATGRQTLEKFAALQGCRLICRQIDPPDGPFPFPGGEFLVGQPPFAVADERALFTRLRVDWLVVKNAGGTSSYSKLEAARDLGLPVLVINRPQMPPGLKHQTVEEALAWIDSL